MLKKALPSIKSFLIEEDGPTAIEYVIMMSLVVIVCLVTINTIGGITQGSLDNSSTSIINATGS